jgi:hypothetical protein
LTARSFIAPPKLEVDVDPSPGPDDAIWDTAPWLDELRDIPAIATWPRYMTAPHPAAVGSYGPQALAWLAANTDRVLRWWQILLLFRLLEHDADGQLVWLVVLPTTSRQSGKSIVLQAIALWRLHQSELFGEPQTILHIAKDLPIAKEVQREMRAWARERGYPVREQNGNEQITEPESGARWIIRGKDSVYGYAGSLVIVDESWGVPVGVVDEGLEPTMLERRSPQMLLTSTAHRKATGLFPTRRSVALDSLWVPQSTLLIEWSAPRGFELEDRDAWRASSPHWGPNRERWLEQKLAVVLAGETLDPDEADPGESFRTQYGNVWSERTVSGHGETLVDMERWARARVADGVRRRRVWVAVEDDYGNGAAVAAVADIGDGRFELDGWLCPDVTEALRQGQQLASERNTSLIVGANLIVRGRVERAGSAETRFGLPLMRHLIATGRVVHDRTEELDVQLAAVRVKPVSGGLTLLLGTRADCVRAACWALRAANAPRPAPSIG